MQNEDLEIFIRNINSSDDAQRNQAIEEIQNYILNGNLLQFVESLSLLISIHKEDINFVTACIVFIQRALLFERTKFKISPRIWCGSQNLPFIHETITSVFG